LGNTPFITTLSQDAEDAEYESEVSESDDEDSDIDIDENEEVKSDNEDEPLKKKRRVGIVTKAYKVCLLGYSHGGI
jgi:hypothetical protein